LNVNVLREFSEEMKVVSLPSSPLSYVMFFFILGIVAGSFLGIESIMRYNAIIVPVIAAGYIVILLGIIPKLDISNIYPILGLGADDIFIKGFFRVSVFGELIVFFLLPPFIGNNRKTKAVGFTALGFSSAFLIVGSLTYILAFPYPGNLESFLPVFHMARVINVGRFFQRIEAIFVLIWAMAALMYLTSTFYFMVYTFAKTAGLKYMRALILPFAIIVFSVAFIPQDLITVINVETQFLKKTAWLVTFVFTGLILAFANMRKRSSEDTGNETGK
jgi:spore germination protein (amino acid permease)